MAESTPSAAENRADVVDAVAYAIGKVIATQNVALTPTLASLDGIGKASAIHTMAMGMVSMLQGEAQAAILAYRLACAEVEA